MEKKFNSIEEVVGEIENLAANMINLLLYMRNSSNGVEVFEAIKAVRSANHWTKDAGIAFLNGTLAANSTSVCKEESE